MEDLSGRKFGLLTAISRDTSVSGKTDGMLYVTVENPKYVPEKALLVETLNLVVVTDTLVCH